jgi:pimeloyl-ACP methyl ester carboxylesterase
VRQKSGRNCPPFNQQLTLSDSIRRFERSHIGHGTPVILLHDGPAKANYWGELVPALAPRYRVIVMDSRGHGRSSRDAQPYGYDLMASDVLALIDFLNIDKAALVGWSDGAIIGLDIAIHRPERRSKLFAFAANSDPSGVKDSPTPTEYDSFLTQITKVWETQPHGRSCRD